MPDHDPIRQKLADARRQQILDAATEIFAEKGFHRATIQDIAQEAGLSHGALYNYFDSKDRLLISVMAQLAELQELDIDLFQDSRQDTRAFLKRLFQHRLDLIEQNQRVFKATLPELLVNPDLQERFYQRLFQPVISLVELYLAEEIEEGRMEPVDVPLAARILHGTFIGLIILRFLEDEETLAGWDDLPEVLTRLIYGGLSPEGSNRDSSEDERRTERSSPG